MHIHEGAQAAPVPGAVGSEKLADFFATLRGHSTHENLTLLRRGNYAPDANTAIVAAYSPRSAVAGD